MDKQARATIMRRSLILLRLGLGWIFFWAFLDKLFGFGFATAKESAWLAGGSPTTGFLTHGTQGPLAEIFQALAGQVWVDWLFMIGLALIGLALILGIGMRIATCSASVMLALMWLAALPPEHNPFMDDHLIYVFALGVLHATQAGEIFGLGSWWTKTRLVKKHPWLA